ncbi:MAG: iron-containing alcohol dehydrogenase [Spirochaetaceae bacterium]|jgi:alcohol dehydrogenase YqhD (iron-dependent ADH family)|nr:iron-containing alcohol dehydrogenase [Spirochaetaceae bacterium]
MKNFTYQNTTKIIFGRGSEEELGVECAHILNANLQDKSAKKVLIHHSGGHAQRSGLIDFVKAKLEGAGVRWVELSGVQPNPHLELVRKGVELTRAGDIGLVLAIGGGSAIDSAKAIAAGAFYEGDVWDMFSKKAACKGALPVGVLLTIPASGSENSDSCVISNSEEHWKKGIRSGFVRPAFAIMNPEYAFTLPPYQIACGVADILAHVMERYFTREEGVELTNELCEGLMRSVIQDAKTVFDEKGRKDYSAWANIMWAGTVAHNNFLGLGREDDWASHHLEHELSGFYDIAHGAGLAIIFPAWMAWNIEQDRGTKEGNKIFARFAEKVWGLPHENDADAMALKGLQCLKEFYRSMGLATSLSEAGIPTDKFQEMAASLTRFGPDGKYRKIDAGAAIEIYKLAT